MNKWIISLAVILPTLIEIIDTSVVNVSLGHIRGSLSAGLDEATWTITAYLVSNAIIIPITGWLSRVFGRKRYLLFSVGLFTLSSFMCGAATSLAMLVFFRVLQGIGGGALQPISLSILLETFPVAQHGMAMAIFGIGIMFGPIVGPVLGGWITDNWSWNWIFYINIPIGILSMFLIFLFIKDPPYLKRIKARIDYWGLLLIATGLGCLQVVLDKGEREDWFSSAFILRLAIISVISLIIFVIVELRSKEPVVNLRVFKNISFSSGNLIQFAAFFALFGSIVLIPMYLQQLMGYNAFLAGLALAPGGVATLITLPIVGKLVSKINPKFILTAGLFMAAYSIVTMMFFNLYVDYGTVLWSRMYLGVGMAMIFVPLTNLTLSTIRKEEMNNATGVFNLVRNLGGSFGIAFITTMLARRQQFHQLRFTEHMNHFDPRFQLAQHKAMAVLQARSGAGSEQAANGLIYGRLMRESGMAAFSDIFFLSTLLLLVVIPLVLFLKRIKHSDVTIAGH
jgi:MFS transporter, DHA2 family, multidrug resistance protein